MENTQWQYNKGQNTFSSCIGENIFWPTDFCLFSPAGSTSFDSGLRSAGFHTIDSAGLFDTGLTNGHFDTAKSGQYDVTLKSGQYDTGIKSSHYDCSLRSGQFDTGLRSGQYDTSVKSGGQYDVTLKSSQYDTSVKSGQYDVSLKSGQYDSSMRTGQYDTLDAILPSFSWSTSTLPAASSTTAVAGNTSYSYQTSTNNMPGGSSPIGLTSPSSLSGETKLTLRINLLPCRWNVVSFVIRKVVAFPHFSLHFLSTVNWILNCLSKDLRDLMMNL